MALNAYLIKLNLAITPERKIGRDMMKAEVVT
jgi:hypothetical protein